MKKRAKKVVKIGVVLPAALHARLVGRLALESGTRGFAMTASKLGRWAIEDYLDAWEGASFVADADHVLTIAEANCLAGGTIVVSRSEVDPALWQVDGVGFRQAHEPMAAAAWATMLDAFAGSERRPCPRCVQCGSSMNPVRAPLCWACRSEGVPVPEDA